MPLAEPGGFSFLPLLSQLLGYLFFPLFFFFFFSLSSPSSGGCLLFPSWLGGSHSHQPQAATRHRRVPPRSLRHPPSFPLGSAPPGLRVLPCRCTGTPAAPGSPPALPGKGLTGAATPERPPSPGGVGAPRHGRGMLGGQGDTAGTVSLRGHGDTTQLAQSRCGILAPPPGTAADGAARWHRVPGAVTFARALGHSRDKLGVSPVPRAPSAVKEEPCEEDPKPAQPKGPPGFPRDVSAAELLQRLSLAQEEELLFLQLPDTLPGQPPSQDTKPSKAELHSEDGQVLLVKQEKSQEAKQAENICTLADLPEGQVGKLLIRKSGKVQLVLGKVTLDVTMGTPCSFLQELVSVGIGDNRTGEMMVLGHVRHKLVCSPDFEALLEHRHR
uniref:RNA polymerase III subunit D n=1 Tax=Junco hyemalis TaxID=40217 RepID=A0A8C5IK45_JUNHY